MNHPDSKLCGFAAVVKPAGMSSAKAVASARRIFSARPRIGHTGTLDPQATGLLVLAVGAATRLIRYLPTAKRYTAQVRFGLRTATDDLEGETVATKPVPADLAQRLADALPAFCGTIMQAAPVFSALKQQGKPQYALARAGRAVKAKVREVTIDSIHLISTTRDSALLDVRCGSGVYIRSLARDLGQSIGSEATLASLQRTECNALSLADAKPLDELGDRDLIEPLALLGSMQRIQLDQTQASQLIQGVSVAAARADDGLVAAVSSSGSLLGIASASAGLLKPQCIVARAH